MISYKYRYRRTDDEEFSQVHIRPRGKSVVIDREVMGIDDAVSYAGGLFGAITPLFAILMMVFNKHVYELQAAQIILKNQNKEGNIQ